MKVFDMAEYFWIQKKDGEGKTIALENRCRVSGESVAEKLHKMDLTKSRFLAQNQVFSLGKFFGNAKSINVLLKGYIREKDEVGRNIPFTLVKEFHPKDNYRNYIRNLNEELKGVFEAAGVNKNEIDEKALTEICLVAQNSDEEQSVFNLDGFLKLLKKNSKTWFICCVILIILIIILFKK